MGETRQLKGAQTGAWVLSGLLALVLVAAGIPKLLGMAEPAATFEHYGYPRWFLYVTGGIEVVCAISLFVPRVRGLAALGIFATMLGAVATHLRFGEGPQAAIPGVLLLLAGVMVYLRRKELPLKGSHQTQGIGS